MIRLEKADWAAVREITCTTMVYNNTRPPKGEGRDNLADLCVPISQARAADAAWRKQKQPSKSMGEGIVVFKSGEIEFMPVRGLVELGSFWRAVTRLTEDFLHNGNAEKSLEDQPIDISLRLCGQAAQFCVDGIAYMVSPHPFIQGLVDGASGFYEWLDKYVGHCDPSDISSLSRIQEFL